MKNPLRILHVEDSPKDSELVETTLEQQGIVCDVLRVETRADYVSALEQSRFDLILGDYTMPGFDGLTALKIAQEKRPDVPFIFVSGTLGEDVAIEALKHGAVDYVLKDRLSRLDPCVRRALRQVEEQKERKRAQEALQESEARKKAMLEGALDCIIAIDHQGKILEFNPAAERTFGYALDQVIGKPLVDLIIPSRLREKHKQGLKQFIATGEGPFIGKVVEVTAMRADGTEFPAELAITSIGQKWPPMFLGHLRDITERKRAEEKMRLQSVALESAANAVVITDRDGIMTWVNPAFTKLTGYSLEEAIGQNPRLLKSGTQDQPFYESLWNTILSGQVWSGEIINRRKDGALYTEEQTITPVRDAQGDIIHFIAIKQNITERKQAEEEIQRNLGRIRALHEIDLAITSTLDLRTTLDILLEKTDRLLLFVAATTVRLLNRETGELEPIACRNIDEKEWKAVTAGMSAKGLDRMLPEKSAPVMTLNVQTDPRSLAPDFLRKCGLVSSLRVPLVVKDDVLGVLAFFTKEEHQFTDEEVEFLTTLASQTAIAINNAQLYEKIDHSRRELELTNQYLERSLRQLSGLYTALSPLAPSESVHEMMDGIIERLMEATGADAALIRLKDKEKGGFYWASQRGFPESYLKATASPPPGSALEQVFNSGEPVIASDIASDSRLKGKNQLQVGLRSCAMLPLKVQQEVRGIVHLASRKPGYFDEEQGDHLMAIARQMGIALENKDHFDNLRSSRDELEKSNRVKDEFLSVMSHELRTPLNVVVGYTGMIMDGLLGEVNDKQKEAMEKVINRTNDQLAMVNNILYATIIETEKIKVESHPVVLGDFFKQLSSTYETPLNKQLLFNWDCPSPLAVFHTDSAKLKQILQNLIDNALKFTGKGSVTVSARITEGTKQKAESSKQTAGKLPTADGLLPTGEGRWVELKVADTGVGIPPDALPLIFDKFKQVDSSETRLFGGVGMGLYIVRKFAELLGGTVEVESEAGKGSTFTVTLPCGQ